MKPTNLLLLIALFSFFLFFSPSFAHNKSYYGASSLHVSFKGCFSKVYSFGDSSADTGNAHALAHHHSSGGGANSAHGSTSSGGGANSSHGSTASTQSNKRLCDGRHVIDFLCEALSLPNLPPYKGTSINFTAGVNFAIAGLTALSSDVFGGLPFNPLLMWKRVFVNLQTEVDWFSNFLQEVECKGKSASSCKAELENALFWVGATAVDDFARSIQSSLPLEGLAEMSIGYIHQLIQTLLDNGAKYLVVQGLPPIGCLPLGISSGPLLDKMGCCPVVNSAAMMFNQILQMTLANLRTKFPSSTIVYADYWNAYLEILANPAKYNFQEAFKACCGGGGGEINFNLNSLCGSAGTSTCDDPSKYINWDGIHLTEAMNQLITDLFLNQGYCQPSFDQLIKNKLGPQDKDFIVMKGKTYQTALTNNTADLVIDSERHQNLKVIYPTRTRVLSASSTTSVMSRRTLSSNSKTFSKYLLQAKP